MEAATTTTTVYPAAGGEHEPTREATPSTDRPAVPATAIETFAIFALFAIVYALVGTKVVTGQHVVVFDALDRLSRAFMVWHNDPPKLAAIGFSMAPTPTVALLPFAAFTGLVTSGIALPLSSALFGGAALAFFNRMFAAADMGRLERWALIVLVAVNPMFAFYAMNGTGDMVYLALLAFLLFSLVGWGRASSPRYLIGAGLAIGILVVTRYEFLLWALFLAIVIAFTLREDRRSDDEVEGSTIAFLAPAFYAIGVWMLVNAIVVGDPFQWVHTSATTNAPVNGVVSGSSSFDLGTAISLVLRGDLIFPLAFVVLALLLFVGSKRRSLSVGLAGLIVLNAVFLVVQAAIQNDLATIELSDALPVLAVTLGAVAWLYYGSEMRGAIWGLAMVGAVLALPLGWIQMQDYPHQDLEQAFTRAISTGDDQEGTTSRGGFIVGIDHERSMADFVNRLDLPDGQVLTDNARTFGVITLGGHPDTYFDRVDKGDTTWRSALLNPFGRVGYMLVDRSPQDLILSQYPGAAQGKQPFLDPVAENGRYALLRVTGPSPTQTKVPQNAAGASAGSTTAPAGGGP